MDKDDFFSKAWSTLNKLFQGVQKAVAKLFKLPEPPKPPEPPPKPTEPLPEPLKPPIKPSKPPLKPKPPRLTREERLQRVRDEILKGIKEGKSGRQILKGLMEQGLGVRWSEFYKLYRELQFKKAKYPMKFKYRWTVEGIIETEEGEFYMVVYVFVYDNKILSDREVLNRAELMIIRDILSKYPIKLRIRQMRIITRLKWEG